MAEPASRPDHEAASRPDHGPAAREVDAPRTEVGRLERAIAAGSGSCAPRRA